MLSPLKPSKEVALFNYSPHTSSKFIYIYLKTEFYTFIFVTIFLKYSIKVFKVKKYTECDKKVIFEGTEYMENVEITENFNEYFNNSIREIHTYFN